MINEDCSVQIADFGLSRSLQGIQSQSIKLTKRLQKELDEELKTNTGQQFEKEISDQKILGAKFAPIEQNDNSPISLNEDAQIQDEAKT